MRRVTASLMAAGAMVAGLMVATEPALAGAPSAPATAAATPAAAAVTSAPGVERWTMQRRFAREVVRFRDKDKGPYRIEHVTELQYRLKWVGAYKGPVSGFFNKATQRAVKKYQRRVHLKITGIATHKTWAKLIPATIKARPLIPRPCKEGIGWHICYDRYRHQVTLWKRGELRNSWLVRGGDRGMATRTGNFRVYWRDKDHVSGIYGTPMPYSQFFSGGQAFHGSAKMMDPWQDHSAGCVNMYIEDARQLWSMTHNVNLNVHIHGRWDRHAQAPSDAGTARLDIF